MKQPPVHEAVFSVVCRAFDVTKDDLRGVRRTHAVVKPRHIAMSLMRNAGKLSFPQIGHHFRRDHATVISAVRGVENLRRDWDFRETYDQLLAEVKNASAPPAFIRHESVMFKTRRA